MQDDPRYKHRSHVGAAIISRLWGLRNENPEAREMVRAALKAEKSRRNIGRYRASTA
jgi:hypothetical protein